MRYALLFLTALLAGCSAAGPAFDESVLPKSDGATVVVYKNMGSFGMQAGRYGVDFNGIPICQLHQGSFFVRAGISGDLKVSSSVWDMPGTSVLALEPKPRNVYYVRIDVNDGVQFATAAGGLIGAALAGAGKTGPFLITQIEPAIAVQELQGLKQDCI